MTVGGLLIVSVLLTVFALVLVIGPQNLRQLGVVTRLLVAAGVVPPALVASAQPFSRAAAVGTRSGARGARGGAATPEEVAAVCGPVPGQDPVLTARTDDLSVTDPLAALDLAVGRSTRPAADSGLRPVAVAAPAPATPAAPAADAAAAAAAGPEVPRVTLPAAGAAPGAPPPPPRETYAVELGFFVSPVSAQAFATDLQRRGLAVYMVEQADRSGRVWTYVRTGPFQDGTEALVHAARIEREHRLPATLVVQPPPPAPPAGAPAAAPGAPAAPGAAAAAAPAPAGAPS
jgi:hypothetical protein